LDKPPAYYRLIKEGTAMDNMSFDSEKFTAVWQRVTDSRSVSIPAEIHKTRGAVQTESDMLCGMMEILAQDAECLRTLTKKCQAQARDTLRCMARENLRILKNRGVRYFILKGGADTRRCECKTFHAVSEGLRAIHVSAVSLAEKFTSAAEDCKDPESYRDSTYSEFAAIKKRHAEISARLIGNIMA